MEQRKQILVLAALAAAFGTAWTLGSQLQPQPEPKRVVRNLSIEGDPDHTIEVGRQLLAALKERNWDWHGIPDELLRVPDQYNWQFAPTSPGFWTWSTCPQPAYQDEVAFVCSLYTWRELEVVPGIEGRLHMSGFYIVGWKDGRVERVPVEDARQYPVAGGSTITIFPGMSEYDPALPKR